jgi:hypothetical protein
LLRRLDGGLLVDGGDDGGDIDSVLGGDDTIVLTRSYDEDASAGMNADNLDPMPPLLITTADGGVKTAS